MAEERESLKPIKGASRPLRRRLNLKEEFVLALLPTVTVLIVFAFIEVFSRQRLLFASLASSAFLIYLDPQHGTNKAKTLVVSQIAAALIGLGMFYLLGPGYLSGGGAMVITIALMIIFDVMHPPAVSTSLGFAFRAGSESNFVLFGLAVLLIAILLVLEKTTLWMLAFYEKEKELRKEGQGTRDK